MGKRYVLAPLSILTALVLMATACSPAKPAPTATATAAPPTAVPPTATVTPKPTSTPRPTATPNLAATQQIEARLKTIQSYVDAGYIDSANGDFEELDEFHEEWPQLHWYQWWPAGSQKQYADMIFHGRFQWQTATKTSDLSGCGIVFGVQPNEDHYAIFIDKARIAFLMNRGGNAYEVGKTKGSGRLNLTEPADAEVTVIINGAKAWVIVNGNAVQYTLSADQPSSGMFAYSLLSGTNKDFGTRCDITDSYLWLPGE